MQKSSHNSRWRRDASSSSRKEEDGPQSSRGAPIDGKNGGVGRSVACRFHGHYVGYSNHWDLFEYWLGLRRCECGGVHHTVVVVVVAVAGPGLRMPVEMTGRDRRMGPGAAASHHTIEHPPEEPGWNTGRER